MTRREYSKKHGLNVKKGLIPKDLRELFKKQAYENGTVKNMQYGAKYRFKKGSTCAGKYERSRESIESLKKNIVKMHRAAWVKRMGRKLREENPELVQALRGG
jgi:hypothetical protein